MAKDKEGFVTATVIEALPGAMFKVVYDETGEEGLVNLAGKMRKFRIRVLVGDKVSIKPEPYSGRGRIEKRL